MTNRDKLYELIVKDLTSEISEEEKILFEKSLISNEEQEQNYNIIKCFWSSYFPTVEKNNIIEKTEKKLGLTYHQNPKSHNGFKFRIAATFLLILSLGVIGLYYFISNQNTLEIVEYKTGPDEVKEFVLSDGTQVWLNSSSALLTVEPFKGDYREVRLIGEGYFEVAHNPRKPFLVKTPGLTTKVLGTNFNLISFPKEAEQELSLYEGKVELIDDYNTKNNVVLNPGEQAYFNKKRSQFLIKKTELGQPAAWRKGILSFYDEQLKHIVLTLERRYQTRIIIKDEKIGKLRFTANFEGESLFKILQLLNEAHEFVFYETDNGIIIESL
ncbi:FecR family protein [Maribellus comscasis]|nr:FecR domain-containing protein [Maribellus comscasis]